MAETQAKLVKAARVSLFVVNVLYVLIAITLLAVGGWMVDRAKQYTGVVSGAGPYVSSVVMVVCGVFMIIAAVIGFLSAIKKHRLGLILHILLLLLMVVGVMIMLGVGYEFKDKSKRMITNRMTEVVKEEYPTGDSTGSMDQIQIDFECCGANSYMDYMNRNWFSKYNTHIPWSCCKDAKNGSSNLAACHSVNPIDVNKINTKGCIDEMDGWSDDMFLIVSTLGIIFIIILIIGLLFAMFILYKAAEIVK